ncbi:hypothetical protein T4D_1531 [Trichinella pseudospiralis]|uniref:Uncharacterized protein n=1 Tax=Trichinella pseudospiralis TaxID=6337 RepID=A0A0V1FGG6_TRIPS|nr:hypothetical protein T4D_1531 [Trichinella pseudospiralis]
MWSYKMLNDSVKCLKRKTPERPEYNPANDLMRYASSFQTSCRLIKLDQPEGSSVEEHTKLKVKQKRLLTVVLQLMKNFMEEQILFAFYPDFPPKR